jgi:hypothetical protein
MAKIYISQDNILEGIQLLRGFNLDPSNGNTSPSGNDDFVYNSTLIKFLDLEYGNKLWRNKTNNSFITYAFFDISLIYITGGLWENDAEFLEVPSNAVTYSFGFFEPDLPENQFIGEPKKVNPKNYENIIITDKKENSQSFERTIASNIIFQDIDFDYINNASYDNIFKLIIESNKKFYDNTYYRYLEFSKKDCSFDLQFKNCTASLKSTESTNQLKDYLEKKVDIIAANTPITNMTYYQLSAIQLYTLGETKILTIVGGNYFEQDIAISPPSSSDLFNIYKFKLCGITFYISPTGLSDSLTGGIYDYDFVLGEYLNQNGFRELAFETGINAWVVEEIGSGTNKYIKSSDLTNPEGTYVAVAPQTGSFTITFTNVYSRGLTGEGLSIGSSYDIPDGDIIPTNYTSITQDLAGTALGQNSVLGSYEVTPTPNEYGRLPVGCDFAGQYYDKPNTSEFYYPVARSKWACFSVWYYVSDLPVGFSDEEFLATKAEIVLKNSYKLVDVIKTVLSELKLNITHEENSNYSQILYGTNPFDSGNRFYPFIIKKSSVITKNADSPAKLAEITLKDIFNYLRSTYQIDYRVNEDNQLILEHVKYFQNGQSYTSGLVNFDYTKLLEIKTNQAYENGQKIISYDDVQLPERMQFTWQDKVSDYFEGTPIRVLSNFVDKNNTEDYTNDLFTTDIDFINAAPQDISKTGFTGIECFNFSGIYKTKVEQIILGNRTVSIQNGGLSFTQLHELYWKDYSPASTLVINGTQVTADSIRKSKSNEIQFNYTEEIDLFKYITTSIDNGLIDSIEYSIENNLLKIKLKYEPS